MPDLTGMVLEAAAQIPRGKVSTYGDIARALGDVRASRVVGIILSQNPRPIVVPCHRVVYSDGRVGWYSGLGKGAKRKAELLASEGVELEGGMVRDFDFVRFSDFQVEPVLAEMMAEQERLRNLVVREDGVGEVSTVVGLDVSYRGEMGYAAAAAFDLETMEQVGERTTVSRIVFPYIPGYLSYRELPALEGLLDWEDAVYMIDGQGYLHPRHFGIACHVGVYFDRPTIGVAKSLLCGRVEGKDDGSPIYLSGELSGLLLRSGRSGVYVSVGHRLSLSSCEMLCRRTMRHKVPEPIRRAHALANELRREGT